MAPAAVGIAGFGAEGNEWRLSGAGGVGSTICGQVGRNALSGCSAVVAVVSRFHRRANEVRETPGAAVGGVSGTDPGWRSVRPRRCFQPVPPLVTGVLGAGSAGPQSPGRS